MCEIIFFVANSIDFSGVKLETGDIFIFAGIILAAIGAIWGIGKLINLGNNDEFISLSPDEPEYLWNEIDNPSVVTGFEDEYGVHHERSDYDSDDEFEIDLALWEWGLGIPEWKKAGFDSEEEFEVYTSDWYAAFREWVDGGGRPEDFCFGGESQDYHEEEGLDDE